MNTVWMSVTQTKHVKKFALAKSLMEPAAQSYIRFLSAPYHVFNDNSCRMDKPKMSSKFFFFIISNAYPSYRL